ncbi:MAG TPA: hypothetical protein VNF46_01370, partial [Gammaproteobacteria bacterium]|nr:hypothetical protein [Gammaproteobacteria bacterium]
IRKIRENLGGGGVVLADSQGLFRCISGTDGILARTTVIPVIKRCLGYLQKSLSFGHFAGCGALRTRLLGGRDRLTGIAHVLNGCAGTCRERQHNDQYGKPWGYQDFVIHINRRVMTKPKALIIKLATSHGHVKRLNLGYSDVTSVFFYRIRAYAKSHNLA